LRQLRRSPGFTLTAIWILALGIGAVTAVFSLIDAALLKMLPVENPVQLVQLKWISPTFTITDALSYPALKSLGNQTQVLAGALAFRKMHNIDFEFDGHSGLAEGNWSPAATSPCSVFAPFAAEPSCLSTHPLPGKIP
jgi:hypothetical protein